MSVVILMTVFVHVWLLLNQGFVTMIHVWPQSCVRACADNVVSKAIPCITYVNIRPISGVDSDG